MPVLHLLHSQQTFPRMGFQVGLHIPGIIVKHCYQCLASYTCTDTNIQTYTHTHTKRNIQNTGHKRKDMNLKQKEFWNSGIQSTTLLPSTNTWPKSTFLTKRGKKLTAHGTQGARKMHHSHITPSKCNNLLATGTNYHTKLKYNTSSVTSVF